MNEIEVVHRLSTHPNVNVSVKKKCAIDHQHESFIVYVTEDDLKCNKDIFQEIARFFVPSQNTGEFSNFLEVVTQRSDDSIEDYMQSMDADNLPEDVIAWCVREPPPMLTDDTVVTSETTVDEMPQIISYESNPLSMERPSMTQSTDSESVGLQCWPPRSSAMARDDQIRSKNPAIEQTLLTEQPPPPPKVYDNIQPANDVSDCQQHGNPKPREPYTPADLLTSQPETSTDIYDGKSPKNFLTTPDLASQDENLSSEVSCQGREQTSTKKVPLQQNLNNETQNLKDNTTNFQKTRITSAMSEKTSFRVHPPMYDHIDVELEEVDFSHAVNISDLKILTKNANAEEIGHWGESFVYAFLKANAKNEVIWMNEIKETGSPYDIKNIVDGEQIFIEVKSTASSEKNLLEISSQEIKCAFEKQNNYHLYRVYNAGKPQECRIERLCNLAYHLDRKSVRMFIII